VHRRWLQLTLAACVVAVLAGAARLPGEPYTIELGPFTLPPNVGHYGFRQPDPLAMKLPVDGWLRGLSYELVDEKGERLPKQLLHHLNLIVPERRELFSQIMLRIGAAGPETAPYTLPAFMGYRVHPGDSLLVIAMLHNPTSNDYQAVRLRVRLQVSQGMPWLHPISIQPVYLDVMPPAGDHVFDLPPGRSQKSWEGRPAVAARLFAVGGHLHRYGTTLRFEDVSTGKVIWDARPKLDAKGEVEGMPINYFLPFGIELFPDHVYRLTAEYDNPTGRVLVEGGMGALGGIVRPASGIEWPTVARNDSVYQHDVWSTVGLGSSRLRSGHHQH
jgi:hypothetical protein